MNLTALLDYLFLIFVLWRRLSSREVVSLVPGCCSVPGPCAWVGVHTPNSQSFEKNNVEKASDHPYHYVN